MKIPELIVWCVFAVIYVLALSAKKSIIARDYLIRMAVIPILVIINNQTLKIWTISIFLGLSAFTCIGLLIMKVLPGLFRYTHKRINVNSELYNRDVAAFFMRSGLYMFLLGSYLWL